MTGRRPRRVEHLDESLERNVRVRKGTERGLTGERQLLVERFVPVHLGPQHERVDEHADDIVERLLASACNRRTDDDVIGARQAGQQNCQCRMDHHEQ